jgi:cytochrome P450
MSATNEQSARPTVDFDHHRPATDRHPWEMLKELRDTCPVAWSEHYGGFWIVTRHQDVSRVFKDQRHFRSSRDLLEDPEFNTFNIPSFRTPPHLPTELDPPEHIRVRRLQNDVRSPGAIERLRDRVEDWTDFFLDKAIERGRIDLTYEYASPVLGAVTLEWLGLSTEHAPRISHAYHDMLGFPEGHERQQTAMATLGWMYEWSPTRCASGKATLATTCCRGSSRSELTARRSRSTLRSAR